MTPYVPRAFDTALDRAVLAGGLVVLEGESVSGKTRSAYEAIRWTVPDRRLIVPSDEQSLTAIADLLVEGLAATYALKGGEQSMPLLAVGVRRL